MIYNINRYECLQEVNLSLYMKYILELVYYTNVFDSNILEETSLRPQQMVADLQLINPPLER